MSSQTSSNGTVNQTDAVQELLAKREAVIAKATEEAGNIAAAQEAKDKKAVLSAGGRLANRVREIGQIELDLALEGHEVEPWQRPATSRNGSKRAQISQAEIETGLERMGALMLSAKHDSTKHSADQRIQGLLKQAADRGYSVTDPRPKKAAKKQTATA